MSRHMDLVRLPVGEAPTERGDLDDGPRDAVAVFPTESRKLKRPDAATIEAALGGKRTKFVSEAELEQNKREHGERLEDGTYSGRTLAEAILAAREEKDAKFKEDMKTIKQGQYRPLDADDLEFVSKLEQAEAQQRRDALKAEQAALQRFKRLQSGSASASGTTADAAPLPRAAPQPARTARKALVVARRQQRFLGNPPHNTSHHDAHRDQGSPEDLARPPLLEGYASSSDSDAGSGGTDG